MCRFGGGVWAETRCGRGNSQMDGLLRGRRRVNGRVGNLKKVVLLGYKMVLRDDAMLRDGVGRVLELESPLPVPMPVRRYRSPVVPLFLGFRKIPALAIDTKRMGAMARAAGTGDGARDTPLGGRKRCRPRNSFHCVPFSVLFPGPGLLSSSRLLGWGRGRGAGTTGHLNTTTTTSVL